MTVKKSLFIQVNWYPRAGLVKHLEHIRLQHKDRGKDDYIYNVVLDEIGGANGLSPNLDVIMPYLPGGAKQCFDNVFVGSHYVKWQGAGNAYNTGILDGGHRWRNLDMQKRLWTLFRAKYPKLHWHSYVNHEGVLDLFDSRKHANAYEAYLVQSVRDSREVAPGGAVLWAPAIWVKRGLNWRERAAIKRVFTNIRTHSRSAGVTWLHLQDMQGRKYPPSLYNVRTWYSQLKKMNLFRSLAIDMELFQTARNGSLSPMSFWQIAKAEAYYAKYGIPVGASWELRWWYAAHFDV